VEGSEIPKGIKLHRLEGKRGIGIPKLRWDNRVRNGLKRRE
jgi:hypothetical protein